MLNEQGKVEPLGEDTLRQSVLFHAAFEEQAQKRMKLRDGRVVVLRDDARVRVYWQRVLGPKWRGPFPPHWCGAFALWCIQQAGMAGDVIWQIDGIWGKGSGFCGPQKLPRVKVPKPGDVVTFAKLAHHALVERVAGGVLYTIDGNQPHIQRRERDAVKSVPMYYSIAPFLSRALGREVQP